MDLSVSEVAEMIKKKQLKQRRKQEKAEVKLKKKTKNSNSGNSRPVEPKSYLIRTQEPVRLDPRFLNSDDKSRFAEVDVSQYSHVKDIMMKEQAQLKEHLKKNKIRLTEDQQKLIQKKINQRVNNRL